MFLSNITVLLLMASVKLLALHPRACFEVPHINEVEQNGRQYRKAINSNNAQAGEIGGKKKKNKS